LPLVAQRNGHVQFQETCFRKERAMGKGLILWLLGVPVSVIVLLWLVGILR
jgi:hypothetical protein